ncbi:hypothetical protein [Erythrobacter sp. THAF29]|uniref:hypothetical protein n=1 Tax=Erythrobacter sp. THAF29 TaxID=2587851 RepID=UPI001267B733|nr:hypothetical protein [Erythrobacter sp. THAF29]QFT77481.1 hypothetical protein FIU90_08020 [Erythrobacter sp. THAF29]
MKFVNAAQAGTIAIAATLLASAANAETLPVEGIYGAREDVPADIEVIVAENFVGDMGYDLEERLSDVLSRPIGDEDPFFRIIPAMIAERERIVVVDRNRGGEPGDGVIEVIGEAGPDALLRGSASSRVFDQRTDPKIKKECVKRDDKKKCVEHREYRVPCRQMRVTYNADVALITPDGIRIYDNRDGLSSNKRYCRDESSQPNPDAMISGLASRFISNVKRDLLPEYRNSEPRLLEKRKGISKDDRKVFKQALKLTKNDPYGACQLFDTLEATNPDNMSVLFNIGLCRESEDRLDEAADFYERVLAIEPDKNYPLEGLSRIASRRRGNEQLAAREALRADRAFAVEDAAEETGEAVEGGAVEGGAGGQP